MNVRKLVLISMFVSMAIILSYIEHLIPTPFLIAGAKLGLSNIITVVTIKLFKKSESFSILIIRIISVAMLFSGFSGFLYSFTGGMLSYIGMLILIKIDFKEVSLIGVSVLGAVLHSFGQVVVAVVIFENLMIFNYLTVLLLTSVVTGIFVGITGNAMVSRLEKSEIVK